MAERKLVLAGQRAAEKWGHVLSLAVLATVARPFLTPLFWVGLLIA